MKRVLYQLSYDGIFSLIFYYNTFIIHYMTSDNPELSIIVISYNTAKITLNCLNSIIKSIDNIINYEIIVIDNASTDSSQSQISKLKSQTLRIGGQNHNLNLKTIFNTLNLGFARANNQGVKIAKGKYILFLNSDIIVLDDAIAKLLNYFKQNENPIDFIGGKLFEKDGKTPQPSCGPFYSLPVIFGALFLKGDHWGLTRSSPDKIKKVDWVSGACILTTKEKFNKIQGFDEKIFMYMDEIDLLFRAKKAQMQTLFYPQAQFIHLASASSGGKTYPILQVYRGFIYFYKKHHSPPYIFFLKFLLKLKAVIALLIGRLTQNQYLIQTYEKALRLTQEN